MNKEKDKEIIMEETTKTMWKRDQEVLMKLEMKKNNRAMKRGMRFMMGMLGSMTTIMTMGVLPVHATTLEDGEVIECICTEECSEGKVNPECVVCGYYYSLCTCGKEGTADRVDVIDEIVNEESSNSDLDAAGNSENGEVRPEDFEAGTDNNTEDSIENSEEDSDSDLVEDSKNPGALTPVGNLTLVDDYGTLEAGGKQFITVVTKSGDYFYIIIDRDDNGSETVHFLNMVDESDILSLMEEEEVETYMEAKEEVVDDYNVSEKDSTSDGAKEEKEEPQMEASGSRILFSLFVVGVLGVGAFLYMKTKKKSKPNNDGFDPDGDYIEDEDIDDVDLEAFEEDDAEENSEDDLEDEDVMDVKVRDNMKNDSEILDDQKEKGNTDGKVGEE